MAASPSSLVARSTTVRSGVASVRTWPARRWVVALVAGVLAAVAIGVPTGVVHTGFYTRMTPVLWWNYPVWAVSAVLVGLTAATYVRVREGGGAGVPDRSRRTLGATLLATFAVGCPICNKLVVGLIGASGALTYWAPLQPLLGVLSVGLLATGLVVRLSGPAACPVAAAS